MGANLKLISVQLTRPADATAYGAGDVLNDAGQPGAAPPVPPAEMFFGGLGSQIGGAVAYVTKVIVASDKPIVGALRLWLFSAATGIATDNAPFAPSYNNLKSLLGYVDLATQLGFGGNPTLCQNTDARVLVKVAAAANPGLYAVLTTVVGFTPASGQNFQVTLGLDL